MNNPSLNTYAELAAIILHWWQAFSLSACMGGLVVIFFFTLHKGMGYRVSYLTLLVVGTGYIYAVLLEGATAEPSLTDALLPILFTAWSFTCWTRAVMLLSGLKRHRLSLKQLAESDMSNETDWIPYLETSLFAERAERWQKWFYLVVACAFAGAILNNNVTGVERVLRATLSVYQRVIVDAKETKQSQAKIAHDLREKNIKDSLWRAYVKWDRGQQLAAIKGLKDEVKAVRVSAKRPPFAEKVVMPLQNAKPIQLQRNINKQIKVGNKTVGIDSIRQLKQRADSLWFARNYAGEF